ncbi:MAG: hypothetical protein NC084_10695 [Bacteroides sp.]|nr:hypothetical protein [Eubacterium sp.]MCM1417536.1 hypothetical protein [Roseburia sp.]MCM1463166.1 hypothetical protein [Bacteroides sp.]
MAYQDDKRELLKLKQGLIEESETIREEEKPVYELHGWKRVANFFYHYKWHVVVIAFFVAVAGFFLYDMLKDDVGDLRVLVVAKDSDVAANVGYKTQDLELAFEQYCPDFDDNGYVHVDVYNIDLSENIQQDYMLGNVTKLTGEIGYGEAQMYLLDTPALESITTDGDLSGFVDLSALYPDDPQVDGVFYRLCGSGLATLAHYVEACPEDLFLVVRKVDERTANHDRAEKAQKRALEVMDHIVSDTFAGWHFEEGRIYGIEE